MYYKLSKSPKRNKKFRIVLPYGKTIDFGAKGYSDYTLHKNSLRMRLYVQRHGGHVFKQLKEETNTKVVQNKMLKVKNSDKEDWSKTRLNTAGFWSRWLLWSFPNLQRSKKYIENKFKIRIKQ